ncbi:TetR/AcrR family transcriptional regulator [Streptomyces sp. NPDC051940]|uniref:TetR/AcrR family transcriptional regulator n=1 Tax=Streptomyces sp. NPDC051940 TaxID=3155675 RepID=UPI00343F8A3F
MGENKGGRSGYHHGDLENALVGAAMELAREGGPEAVVLREAARRVGVSATAAYRHFADRADLLAAVKAQAQQALADTMAAVVEELGGGPRERFFALGRGYVRFAVEQPGLYRVAFCRIPQTHGFDAAGKGDRVPSFGMLVGLLDELQEAGVMRPGARQGAEVAAWATVHGLAMLILDGPLSTLPDPARDALVDGALTMVIEGLTVA